MQLVAYTRVSTDRQAERGNGLDVQRATIKQWAKANDHTVSQWATDEGVSGSNGLDSRVGLFDAVAAVQDGTVEGLVVYKLDRLARDLILQETILGMIWKNGAHVYSTMSGEDNLLDPAGDAEDPSRRMTRQILGAVAEYERATIRLRLRSGKLAKRARGGYIGGQVPFGYRLGEDGILVPAEAERAAIERMISLRNQGRSLQAICDVLTEEGFTPKGGGRWHTAVVGKIIRRELQENSHRPT